MTATDASSLHVQSLYSHHGWLLGWLQRKLGHVSGNAEAADLAQDTFLRILVAHKRDQACEPAASGNTPESASRNVPQNVSQTAVKTDLNHHGLREPRAYLITVASRVLFNHYRRLSLEQAYLQALQLLPENLAPSPEERLIILETLNGIDTMLQSLPAKVRNAFLLSQLEGLSYAEIATQLNVSERTVKRYMALAFEECIMLGN